MKKRDNEKKKKDSVNFFWAKLETKEEAEKVIKDSFWFFLIIAIMIGILYVVVFGYYLAVFEALLLLFFAFMVKTTKSRFFAVALFALICIQVVFTILARLGITEGGTNIFLAALYFIVGLNTLRATFKYKSFNKNSNKIK